MAVTPSCKVVYTSPYQGGTKSWSNRYHWTGPDWASQGQFDTFAVALETQLIAILTTRSTMVQMVAYQAGSDLPAYTHAFGTAGTFALSTFPSLPLETVALARWTTDARTSKNHPVYLFKYWHDVQSDALTTPDLLRTGLRTPMATRATALVTGISDGTNTRKLAGPNGAVAQAGSIDLYVTHRDFPT